VIAGGESDALPAFSSGGDPRNSIVRIQLELGGRGASATAIPGALTSIGISPVATSTRSHWLTPGISSGTPVPVGLVMSASPTRKIVCVHVLPCAPTRAGAEAAGIDPVGDHIGDDGVEQGEQIGARRQRAESIDGDRRTERWPFLGQRRRGWWLLRAHGRRERDDRRRDCCAIESGHAGNHFQ
jgi:hypothetical protein